VDHVWGIDQYFVVYCILHAIERITEAQLCRTSKDHIAARLWLILFFGKLNKTNLLKREEEASQLTGKKITSDFGPEGQVVPLKLVLITKAEFENPSYEIASFGMMNGKACEAVIKTQRIFQ